MGSTGLSLDFALDSILRVRLLNASPRDQSVVRRQIGPLEVPVGGDADIWIRFVDRFPTDPELKYLGDAQFAYGADDFYVIRGKHKSQIMVQMPMEAIGGPIEVVCGRGAPAVPYLIALINLTALAKGFLPLHASAVRYADTDLLFTGWAKGGKTESLLGFANQGASYIGDEWIYLSPDGHRMVGVPEPIRLWDWHIRGLPQIFKRLTKRERLRLNMLRGAEVVSGILSHRSRLLRRVSDLIHRQRYVQVPPERLFGDARCEHGQPAHLFFVVSHAANDYTVRPIAAERVAAQMQFSMLEEFSDLLACYRSYRFAFPERKCPLLEQLADLFSERLHKVLHRIPASIVLHPYPACPQELLRVMEGYAVGGRYEEDNGSGPEDGEEEAGADAPEERKVLRFCDTVEGREWDLS